MTLRVEISGTQVLTYTQAWDAENRLSVVTNTVTLSVTQLVYDGDGNLAKKVEGGYTTVYAGSHYEVLLDGGQVEQKTSHYAAVGARVMRVDDGVDDTVYYILTDHLGSASVTLDASGSVLAEQRYYAFGATRLVTGEMQTDRLYTGQREMAGLGLYHYGARFYHPALGRFISADTIVPNPGNPQDLNRYTYVRNNPLVYVDPSGHRGCLWYDYNLDVCIEYDDPPQSPSDVDPAPQGQGQPEAQPPTTNAALPELQPPTPILEQTPWCPGAVATGIIAAIPLVGWQVVLGYTAIEVALLPPPASVVGEAVLLVIEAASLEVDMLFAQLTAQGAQRECSQIRLKFWPPYDFGPAPAQH